MKLFPAKCHERATLRKLWRQTGNSSLLPGQQFTVDCCCKWWLESQRGFQILLLSFVLLYNKSLNDWSLGEQWILFPENLNVSRDEVEGNIEILGKQNSLFPSEPVIKCLWTIDEHVSLLLKLLLHNCIQANNRPFPSPLVPLFQNKSRSETFHKKWVLQAVSFSCKSKSFS